MKIAFETNYGTKSDGKRGSIQNWIDKGYGIFASEGLSSIQIERIARSMKKNKSGFYYFFKDRESFIDALMSEHLSRLDSLTYQIREASDFQPDFFLDHKEVFFFQIQLVKNREVELFDEVLNHFNTRIAAAIIPIWSDYLESSIEVADKLWGLTRDAIFCRARQESFTQDWLLGLMAEAKLVAGYHQPQLLAYS
ncbi:TetR/AcrR family transcriptional regulator [Algoriphagus aestuariicola]|uniref:TetR/AcrR family transcriptional regulator n=1 Tax=Algoriphagus aestuariicola TaxID=1852016 RepID=A0ABS3BMY2_9BACT|nr:TetR/AcrR family transcriptional regulator [Algoriphagus aestuariicola]MBN7800658.1 TetR/AcrR family transcriptional regulator [Algoriphagus aestuariicola]